MSNPKSSNKDEFKAILSRLVEVHRQKMPDISRATGIGERILSNAYNDRPFGAKTDRVNSLRAYLNKLENPIPAELQMTEQEQDAEIKRLKERIAAIEKMLKENHGEKLQPEENGANS